MKRAVLSIQGMSCGHCLNAVNRALGAIPGVKVDSVQLGRAVVEYDERVADQNRLSAAVTEAGYAVVGAVEASP